MAKPRNPDRYYFNQPEEDAVIAYNKAKTQAEKEKIYMESLHVPFQKLVECVYRRYNYSYITLQYGEKDGMNMCLSHLATILDKYDQPRGRAFSFFSMCAKHFLTQLGMDCYKDFQKTVSLDAPRDTNSDDDNDHSSLLDGMILEAPNTDGLNNIEFNYLLADELEKNRKMLCTKEKQHKILDAVIKAMKSPDDIDFFESTVYSRSTGKKDIFIHLKKELGMETMQFASFLKKLRKVHTKLYYDYLNGKLEV